MTLEDFNSKYPGIIEELDSCLPNGSTPHDMMDMALQIYRKRVIDEIFEKIKTILEEL